MRKFFLTSLHFISLLPFAMNHATATNGIPEQRGQVNQLDNIENILNGTQSLPRPIGDICDSVSIPDESPVADPNEDIQERIWALSESGKSEEARKLKAELEEKLSKGEVIEMKPLNMGGKHSSYKVKLSSGVDGVFKPYNFWDNSMNYKSEIAAYLADEVLGFNLVPMTIKRKIKGEVGSLQLFIKNSTVARDLPENERQKGKLLELFDYLIRGTDRNPGNYLYKKGRVVAIDHGWTFRPWDIYHQPPGSNMWSLDKGRVFKFLPDEKTYNQLLNVKDNDLRKALSPYLSNHQINDLIKRKNKFIYKVKKWIGKIGREKVFSSSPLE